MYWDTISTVKLSHSVSPRMVTNAAYRMRNSKVFSLPDFQDYNGDSLMVVNNPPEKRG